MSTFKVKKLVPEAIIPYRNTFSDAGLDLFSVENVTIEPGESVLVHIGIAIQIPVWYEAQVRPRSGLALKHQITVLNSPGTVDAGYRGEICVILINHGKQTFQVTKGMKIAQMVVTPTLLWNPEEVEELEDSLRGQNGWGSSGV